MTIFFAISPEMGFVCDRDMRHSLLLHCEIAAVNGTNLEYSRLTDENFPVPWWVVVVWATGFFDSIDSTRILDSFRI